MTTQHPVLVLDFGAQYNQLIARRIRECHVFCEVIPYDTPPEAVRARAPSALVLSGGPDSVYLPGAPHLDPALLTLGIPVLGICYGFQAMALALGAPVERAALREYGRRHLRLRGSSGLLAGVPDGDQVWMSHGDRVLAPPAGFSVVAETDDCPVAAAADETRRLFGVQFHPEVAHTPHGRAVFENFLEKLAGIHPDWHPAEDIESRAAQIRDQVGDDDAIVALSGGVDSAVAAALAARALGPRLHAILVDHGLMRADEVTEVRRAFSHLDLTVLDEAPVFLAALAGVSDPEAKRKIIGREFIRAFERAVARFPRARFLVQGTVYPDVIESGGKDGRTIKSHHNVGGLPEDIAFTLVEPLRWLFKDEVRELGSALGLPESLVWRQPFPGPGLAVRIIGEVTPEKLAMVRAADAVVRDEIRRAGLDRQIWQAFAVLLDVRSVGVMGDERTYGHPIVVRAVESQDGMTADWVALDRGVLDRIQARIIGSVPGVNRVVYDITSKPPGTIEWE
ncbi:MAG: glutamine-hydrolyzing GMP synthase [Clostridia bacterium]